MTDEPAIYRRTTANRLLIADLLATLSAAEWEMPTLCAGWTVHHLAAHLVQPMVVGFGRFLRTAIRYRGDTARTVDHITRQLAGRTRAELLTLLRDHAGDRVNPPRVGPLGPFADTCIHLRDIARPLGRDVDVPIEHWRILLTYLTSPTAAPALVPRGRLDNVRLVATDTDWAGGSGLLVTGRIEALALAITGRAAALADLSGPGAEALAARLPREARS